MNLISGIIAHQKSGELLMNACIVHSPDPSRLGLGLASILLSNTFLEHKSAQISTDMDHKVHYTVVIEEVSQICFVFDKIILIIYHYAYQFSVGTRISKENGLYFEKASFSHCKAL